MTINTGRTSPSKQQDAELPRHAIQETISSSESDSKPLTENWRVDSEEPGKGQVGEQREAAAGHQPDAQLLGLDLAEFLGKPRPSPVAGRRPRRLGRPRVRR